MVGMAHPTVFGPFAVTIAGAYFHRGEASGQWI